MLRRAAIALFFLGAACSAPARTPAPAPARTPALALAPALAIAPAPAPAPDGARCLSIAAWNDLHGQLAPDTVPIDTGLVPAGGVVALADEIAALRATGDVVVTLDGGDLFTGPLESTLAEGAPVVAAYNVIGVDSVVIGNHEFDFGPVGADKVTAPSGTTDDAGPAGPRGALLERMREARFPFLAANIFTTAGQRPQWPALRPSITIDRGGFRVGVVGYTTRDTPTTTLKPNVADLDFAGGAADAVAAEIRALRAARAFPVLLLAHASIDGELPQEIDDPKDPQGAHRAGEIARLLDELGPDKPDAIVGGHRHAWMLGRVRGVAMVTSDQHGVGVTRIRYCRPAGGGEPTLDGFDRRVTLAEHPPVSDLGRRVAEVVAPWQQKVAAQAAEIVAKVPRACAAQGLDGTAMAEQMARALAEHASTAAPPKPGARVVGLMNTGGIRAPLRAGPVTFADLFTVSPFENAVAVCETTRAGLSRVLTNAVRRPIARERLTFGLAGAHVTLKRDATGLLAVTKLDLDGDTATAPRSDADAVWLAIPDFVLWGGDGLLDGVPCASSATSQLRLRDAWREVLAREGACDGAAPDVTVVR
jgi:5'-nucleotidase